MNGTCAWHVLTKMKTIMANLDIQAARTLFSAPRLKPYLNQVDDEDLALELYQWGTELEGAFHATLSFLEIALRNAIDRQLQEWNNQQFSEPWTSHGNTREEISIIAGKSFRAARTYAQKELERKHGTNINPTHDDILAQFTFGNLSYFFKEPGRACSTEREETRKKMWDECLRYAFPDLGKIPEQRICNAEDGLLRIGRSLEYIRVLRNKVAHHDNLLRLDVRDQIHGINSVLSKLHPALPGFAMARSQLRRLRKEDPRRTG